MKNHSILVDGHRTSVSLETEFWESFKEIAACKGLSISALATRISAGGYAGNFTSALRVYILSNYRNASTRRDAG